MGWRTVQPVLVCLLAALSAVLAGLHAEPLEDQALRRAQVLYRQYCASCHGAEARGDGPVAEALRKPPTDLTTIARRRNQPFPSNEVAEIIDGRLPISAHGTPEMPVWGLSFRDWGRPEDQEEQVAHQIHLLARLLELWQQPLLQDR